MTRRCSVERLPPAWSVRNIGLLVFETTRLKASSTNTLHDILKEEHISKIARLGLFAEGTPTCVSLPETTSKSVPHLHGKEIVLY